MMQLLLCIALVCCAEALQVTIDNMKPRLDVHGNIMDAHDGSIQQFEKGGLYYYHAMQYGLCELPPKYPCDAQDLPGHCGFQNDHNISIWSSPTMASGTWTYVGNSIDVSQRPAGIVWRPHLVYNPNTKLYVLFWNWVVGTHGYPGFIAVAIAATPGGPFKMANDKLNLTRGASGDFAIFVDDDGKGYVIYSDCGVGLFMEELTSDYYHTSGGAVWTFPEKNVEAPFVFKKDGIYYALYTYCCCFCLQGSSVQVYTASHALGPYTQETPGELACYKVNTTAKSVKEVDRHGLTGDPVVQVIDTPGHGCQSITYQYASVVRSQQNYIVKVTNATGYTTYIWTGDRWGQTPDNLKGHEPQYWMPLTFNSNGSIQKLYWMNNFTYSV